MSSCGCGTEHAALKRAMLMPARNTYESSSTSQHTQPSKLSLPCRVQHMHTSPTTSQPRCYVHEPRTDPSCKIGRKSSLKTDEFRLWNISKAAHAGNISYSTNTYSCLPSHDMLSPRNAFAHHSTIILHHEYPYHPVYA